jgi:hypothetical protein
VLAAIQYLRFLRLVSHIHKPDALRTEPTTTIRYPSGNAPDAHSARMTWLTPLLFAALWSWPIAPAQLTAHFVPPEQEWSRGHRGIDIAAIPGDVIRSIGAGQVAFVGTVAGTPVVAIEHPSAGLRSTYQPVDSLLRAGDAVSIGEPIGWIARLPAGSGGHCAGRCLHLGLRGPLGYVNPLTVLPRPTAVLKPLLSRSASPATTRGAPTSDAPVQRLRAAARPTHGYIAGWCPTKRDRAAPGPRADQPLPQEHG